MRNVVAIAICLAVAAVSISCKKDKDKKVTLQSIEVTAQPTKKTYEVNESFETAGMVVTATYSDKSTSPVTVTADMLTYNFSAAGTNFTVTITYEGLTATVTGITVSVPTVASIAVTTQPAKKEYFVGETFSTAGMVVTATYSDKSTSPVTVTAGMFTYNFSTVGTKTVTITYEGKTTTVTGITVSVPVVTSIAVTTQPAKKEYFVGETFSTAEMVVTATYSDQSTLPVTVTAGMLTYDFSTAGTKTVTITYEGKSATVTGITVMEYEEEVTLQSIEVTAQPTKNTYEVNQPFETAGMVVTATYSDESTTPVTVTAAMLTYDFSTAGTKTVTITYEGLKATVTGITVTAAAPVLVTDITITPDPASVAVGSTVQLTATVMPVNATNKNITWSSSDDAIATVSATGLVTGVSEGSATITATAADGSLITVDATVTVTPVYTVTFNSNGGSTVPSQTVNEGDNATEPAPAPTKTGSTFAGWFEDAALSTPVSFPHTVTGNVTFYAKWTAEATDGVLINGIVWAACNVDAFGTFAANPEDAGMFYQWNRPTAWAVTGTVSGWDSSNPSGTEWEAANDPCPTGWRVPTTADFLALSNTANVTYAWTTLNGVDGGRFTDKTSDAWIFFPAAGYRNSSNGALNSAGSHAYYWSSTQSSSTNAYYLNSSSGSLSQSSDYRAAGRSVRCVKD